MNEAKRGGGFKRWLLRIIVLILALCLLAAASLLTGIPQKQLARKIVGKALNAEVETSAVSFLDKIKIDELRAFKKDGARTPIMEMKGLEVDYALTPPDKRNIASVHIDSLQMQRERQRAPEHAAAGQAPEKAVPPPFAPTMFSRFKSKLPKLPKFDPQRLLPKSIEVAALDFSQAAPSFGFGLAAPRVSISLNKKDDFTADLGGENVAASWWAGSPGAAHKFDGKMTVHAQKHRSDIVLDPLQISFPGMADIAGIVRIEKKNKDIQCNVNLEKAILQDLDFSQVDPRDLRMPFAFQRLDLSGSRIQGPAGLDMNGFRVTSPEIAVKLAAEGLKLGPKGQEFYDGPLHADLTGTPGDINLALDLTLNRGQKVHAGLSGPVTEVVNRIKLEGWSKDDLFSVLPGAPKAALEKTPIAGLNSLEIESRFKLIAMDFQATIKPSLSTTTLPVEIQAKGALPVLELSRRLGNLLSMSTLDTFSFVALKVADGTLSLEKKQGTPPMTKHWAATLDKVSLAQWVQALSGSELLAGAASPISGTIDIQGDTKLESVQAALEFSQGLVLNAPLLRPLAAVLADRPREKALLESAIAQLEGKDDTPPFTGGKLSWTRKAGGISGELTLKNGALELTLPISL